MGCVKSKPPPKAEDDIDNAQLRSFAALALSSRGCTVKQLLLFYEEHAKDKQITKGTLTRQVVGKVVLPQTAAAPRNYMESPFMAALGGPQQAKIFVSHSWAVPFLHTVLNVVLDASGWSSAKLLAVAGLEEGGEFDAQAVLARLSDAACDSSYWLDIFAVNQHGVLCGDCPGCRQGARWTAAQFAQDYCPVCAKLKAFRCPCGSEKFSPGDPRDEADQLVGVLKDMQSCVLSIDAQLSTMDRAWVVREFGEAVKSMPTRIASALGLEGRKAQDLCSGTLRLLPTQDCDASNPLDKARILEEIGAMDGGLKRFDDFVQTVFELGLGSCTRLTRPEGAPLCALKYLVMDAWCHRQSLLDLSALDIGGAAFKKLPGLRSLTVKLSECEQLANIGALSDALSSCPDLIKLDLDFSHCKKLMDVTAVADGLACLPALRKLKVDFTGCSALEDVGPLGAACGEVPMLLEFVLRLKDVGDLGDVSALRGGLRRMQKLKRLEMDLTNVHPSKGIAELEQGVSEVKALPTNPTVRVSWPLAIYLTNKGISVRQLLAVCSEFSAANAAAGPYSPSGISLDLTPLCGDQNSGGLPSCDLGSTSSAEKDDKGRSSNGSTVASLRCIIDKECLTRDVVRQIVLPATVATKTCYMDSYFIQERGGPRRARKMVAHSWDMPFLQVVLNVLLDASGWTADRLLEYAFQFAGDGELNVMALLTVLPEEVLEKTYWIDMFALNLHAGICGDCPQCHGAAASWGQDALVADECVNCGHAKPFPCPCGMAKIPRGDPLDESGHLGGVLKHMDMLLVAMDPKLGTLASAEVAKQVGRAFGTAPVRFCSALGMDPQTGTALASGSLELSPGGGESDGFTQCLLEVSLGSCRGLSEDEKRSLDGLKHLMMDLWWLRSDLENLAVLGMSSRSFGKLKSLQTFIFKCTGCAKLRRISALAEALGELAGLTRLELDFADCASLCDASAVAQGLGGLAALQTFALDISGCKGVADISWLGDALQKRSLEELSLSFAGCEYIKDLTALGRGIAAQRSLRKLRLDTTGVGTLNGVMELESAVDSLGCADVSVAWPQAMHLAHQGCTLRQLLLFYDEICRYKVIDQKSATKDVVTATVLPETQGRQCAYMDSAFMLEQGGARRAKKLVLHSYDAPFLQVVLNVTLDASGWSVDELKKVCGLYRVGAAGAEPTSPTSPNRFTFHGNMSFNINVDRITEALSEEALDQAYWLGMFAINVHTAKCANCWAESEWDPNHFKGDVCAVCGTCTTNPINALGGVMGLMRTAVVSLDPDLLVMREPWVIAELTKAIGEIPVRFRMAASMPRERVKEIANGSPLYVPLDEEDGDALEPLSPQSPNKTWLRSTHEVIYCALELDFGLCTRLAGLAGRSAALVGKLEELEIDYKWASSFLTRLDATRFNGSTIGKLVGLRRLQVRFTSCHRLTHLGGLSEGLAALPALRELKMEFLRCIALEDMAALGQGLARLRQLLTLDLNFYNCERLGDLESVGQGLSGLQALKRLALHVSNSTCLTDVRALGQGIGDLRQLQDLDMRLVGCQQLADLAPLTKGLGNLELLETLRLHVEECPKPEAAPEIGGQLASLKSLELSLCGLEALWDVEPLGRGLPSLVGLASLALVFRDCECLVNVEPIGQGLGRLGELRSLKLDFWGCAQLSETAELGRGYGQLTQLQEVSLQFAYCSSLSDVTGLGEGLGKLESVTKLHLNFQHCWPSLDDGDKSRDKVDVAPLGFGLSKLRNVQEMELNFQFCEALQDVRALGWGIGGAKHMRRLSLVFSENEKMEDLADFGISIAKMKRLEELKVDFVKAKLNRNMPALGAALRGLVALRSLDVNFEWCRGVRDLTPLGDGLRELDAVSELRLNFTRCGLFQDVRALGLGIGQQKQLLVLEMTFTRCMKLADTSTLGDAFRELRMLRELKLTFQFCKALTDVTRLGAGMAGLKGLQRLELDFKTCKNLVDITAMGRSIGLLGRGNGASLQYLDLAFFGCKGITSSDVTVLADGLRQLSGLMYLKTDFGSCSGLKEEDHKLLNNVRWQLGCDYLMHRLSADEAEGAMTGLESGGLASWLVASAGLSEGNVGPCAVAGDESGCPSEFSRVSENAGITSECLSSIAPSMISNASQVSWGNFSFLSRGSIGSRFVSLGGRSD